VQWQRIVGVITAPNVDNPVAGIKAGAGPWTARDGHARIDLLTGRASFDVGRWLGTGAVRVFGDRY
jgi:hypothetical protein